MPYEPPQHKPGTSDIPDAMRAGFEAVSGADLSGVNVFPNSSKPAAVGALAYTQGSNIYLGPGQDHHLAHETWHVVQQMQNRVPVTGSVAGLPLNDHPALEHEADVMSARAMAVRPVLSLARLTDGD